LEADIVGKAIPLSPDEAADCAKGTYDPRLFGLLWDYYARKVEDAPGTPVRPPM
jgi:hypothetical protein